MKAAFAIFLVFVVSFELSSQDGGNTTKKSEEEITAAFEKASAEINATKEILDKAMAKLDADRENFNRSVEAMHKATEVVNAAKVDLIKKRGCYLVEWEKFNKSRNALEISRNKCKQAKLDLDNVRAKNHEPIQDYRKFMGKGVETGEKGRDTTAKGGVRTKDEGTTAKGSISAEEKKDTTAK